MAQLFEQLAAFSRGEVSAKEVLASAEPAVADGKQPVESVLAGLEEHQRQTPIEKELYETIVQKVKDAAAKLRSRRSDSAGEPQAANVASGSSSDRQRKTGGVDGERMLISGQGEQQVGTGDVIKERFILEHQLGSGGMGRVFKALDLRRQEAQDRHPYVAVKLLSDAFRQHPASFISLQREAKKSQSLSHPNIIKVFDFDRDGGTIYVTMEYLSGRTLELSY